MAFRIAVLEGLLRPDPVFQYQSSSSSGFLERRNLFLFFSISLGFVRQTLTPTTCSYSKSVETGSCLHQRRMIQSIVKDPVWYGKLDVLIQ
jgi:hypothetical protein